MNASRFCPQHRARALTALVAGIGLCGRSSGGAGDDHRAGGEPGRHRSVAGARLRAAADRGGICRPRQRRPGPAGQTRRRQHGDQPARRGRGPLDAAAFQDRLERKAIELSFRSGRDYLRGTLRTLKDNRDEAFDYLRLALTEPRFDDAAVERTRAQTMSRLQREAVSPNDIASRVWWATAFPGHPYGQPVNGTVESVPSITVDDLQVLHPSRAGAGRPQDRGGRRHRRRERGHAARSHLRRAAGQGQSSSRSPMPFRRGSGAASSSSSTCRSRW